MIQNKIKTFLPETSSDDANDLNPLLQKKKKEKKEKESSHHHYQKAWRKEKD